jgi:hypothetical protein
MEKQTDTTKTLGKVIDEIISALGSLDESAKVIAIKAVCEHLKIGPPETMETKPPSPALKTDLPDIKTIPPVVDIKTLREQKKPTSANEMAAVVAFYLSELVVQNDRKQEFDLSDMKKYFNQASYPLPRQPRVLLQNAKNAGYFDSIGEGKYRLNPVGYNLVAYNLPRSTSGSVKRQPSSRRKSAKSKAIKR